ncbi:MAG: cytochrome c oxidase subunit 3 family protein [Deferribacterales bacterium]|jgi:cytochrome c oxidase subunit 3|nr:cytochrome c oxidase subunit 3 family protein [Deferribacterales bacterium]MBZ4647076.1 cytochrome c oxidase subunit [Clostridia bacterium]
MSNIHKDYLGSKFGMWLFLFTEILLFGGLFILYSIYLHKYPTEFHLAGKELNVYFGGGNTVALVTSSLFMAMSISAIQKGDKKLAMIFLSITLTLAFVFLINKYFEWGAKFHHGIYPDSPALLERPKGEIIFFGLYFVMTGLHGIHVIIGAVIIIYVLFMLKNEKVNKDDFVLLENAGLYWHLVDLIWIYLFPLFYLIL